MNSFKISKIELKGEQLKYRGSQMEWKKVKFEKKGGKPSRRKEANNE